MKKVLTESEKNLDDKHIFATTFKLEDCPTLKQKLYKTESLTDPYNPASKNIIRESYPLEGRPAYVVKKNENIHVCIPWTSKTIFIFLSFTTQTQFKCDPLVNPNGMSEHDSRPKEAVMRDERDKQRKEAEYQKKVDDYMGKQAQTKDWKNYFTLADMDHNFVDKQRPTFLDKGSYLPPSTILGNLLRGDLEPLETPFKLFHRTLRHYDKNLCLGEVGESKFWESAIYIPKKCWRYCLFFGCNLQKCDWFNKKKKQKTASSQFEDKIFLQAFFYKCYLSLLLNHFLFENDEGTD